MCGHPAETPEGGQGPFLGQVPRGVPWVDHTTQSPQGERRGHTTEAGTQHSRKRSKEQVLKLKKVLRPPRRTTRGFMPSRRLPGCSTFSEKGKQRDRNPNEGLTRFESSLVSGPLQDTLSSSGTRLKKWRDFWTSQEEPCQGPGAGDALPACATWGQSPHSESHQPKGLCKMLVTNSCLVKGRCKTLVTAETPLRGRPSLSYLGQLKSPGHNPAERSLLKASN